MEDGTHSGRYIAFEGIEGAGKSTVANRVGAYLEERGHHVVRVREPGGTDVGEHIREILLAGDHQPLAMTEAVLFAAARAQLIAEKVLPALEAGSWVLSDRSAYSSLAYQAGGRGLDLADVRTLNDIAIGGNWPDTVVVLRTDPRTGLGRQMVGDRIGDESLEFHGQVAGAFDALAAAEPGRFVVVDASLPLDDVVAQAIHALRIEP
ncbi:MAG: dTMP kinase [Actinomycetota bacterium]